MKRLRPTARKSIVAGHVNHLHQDWLCRYGSWNVVVLLRDLERELKRVRSERKEDNGDQST
jgi:hypothetical protein